MVRFLVLLTLAGFCASFSSFAQSSGRQPAAETIQNPGIGIGRVDALRQDNREWHSPFAAISNEETRYFRTFAIGWAHASAAASHVDGAFMIGFEFNISDANTEPRINSIRPFYASMDGQKASGEMIGNSKGKLEKVIAKNGYAVSGVVFNHTGVLSGIQVKFSRLLPDGTLDTNDTYESPVFGRGGGTVIDGKNLPFCGMYFSPGDPKILDSVAFLVSQKLVKEKAPQLLPRPRGDTVSLRESPPMAQVQPANPEPQRQVIVVNQPNPQLEERVGELLKNATQRLVLVQGANGRGSGFICRMGGKPYCLTNQHVVAGNAQVQFQSLAKGALKVGEARAATGHDLLAFAVPDDTTAFEMVADTTKEVAIGDVVVVLGDPEGAGVVRPIAGRVLGIGPNLIEVSAEFVEGNSGSPIVHVKSGKVVGIASYATAKAFEAGAGEMGVLVRRFGYRLDSVQNWQPVNWQIYQAEAGAVASAKAFTENLFQLFKDIRGGGFERDRYKDPRLQGALARIPKNLPAAPTAQQRTQYIDTFVRELRNASKFQGDDLRRRLRYDYFQRDSEQDASLRELIVRAIEEAKASIPLFWNTKSIPTRRPLF